MNKGHMENNRRNLEAELSETIENMNPESVEIINRISESLAPLDLENLEMVVRIARSFVEENLGGGE